MIEEFKDLNNEEIETMLKVPVLVSILIAGADGDIDKSEKERAIGLTKLKQNNAREDLINYYKEVGKDFEDKLKLLITQFPIEAVDRNPILIQELEKVNDILPKLDRRFAVEFYSSVKDFAKKIAEASGGVLGYMAVGYEESKLIGLNMIKDPS